MTIGLGALCSWTDLLQCPGICQANDSILGEYSEFVSTVLSRGVYKKSND
jgi:hypothetical protein